jgi:hypothetical protein
MCHVYETSQSQCWPGCGVLPHPGSCFLKWRCRRRSWSCARGRGHLVGPAAAALRRIAFRSRSTWCAETCLRPFQRIPPAIEDTWSEQLIRRTAPARCLGRQGLRFHREASGHECGGCLIPRQQSINVFRNYVHRIAIAFARKPARCDGYESGP